MEHSKEIWVIRHGETQWSRSGQHTGRTDVPLTEEGKRQAQALGQILAERSFTLVLTSPLRRARDTCHLSGLGERARVIADLAEWDYGTFEGRKTSEIRTELPGWSIWQTDVPEGEAIEQVTTRAQRVIEEAAAATGDIALFSHGHMLRILTACWLGLDPRCGRLFALDTASISVLGYERETRVIRSWNRRLP
jgi:broad specificity phosphatase PhoE